MSRALGVDLGIKRTGLALSDEMRMTIRALPNRTPKSRAEDIAYLLETCSRESVTDVIIGLPLHAQSGDESMMSKRARGFAQKLEETIAAESKSIAVHLVDERFSSSEAGRRLSDAGIKGAKQKELIDGEAACILLEQFFAESK